MDRKRSKAWGSFGHGRSLRFPTLFVAAPARAVRGVGGTARHGDTVERHALHAATGRFGSFRTERARIHAHPGNFRGKPAVFDLGAAVHHHLEAIRLGEFRRFVIAHAELHPNDARTWL